MLEVAVSADLDYRQSRNEHEGRGVWSSPGASVFTLHGELGWVLMGHSTYCFDLGCQQRTEHMAVDIIQCQMCR